MNNLINHCRKHIKIKYIEKVLGIKLSKWQKKYILGECKYSTERQTGRTLAHILKFLIDDKLPAVSVKDYVVDSSDNLYPYSGYGKRYYQYYMKMLIDIDRVLNSKGIKTRKVKGLRGEMQ